MLIFDGMHEFDSASVEAIHEIVKENFENDLEGSLMMLYIMASG